MPGFHPDDSLPDFETICCHEGEDPSQYRRAVVPPIFQNSLFTFPDSASRMGRGTIPDLYDYTRVSNPTTDIAEAKIAALECGEKARCFGSGMGAISAAILSCVKSGDHVVAADTCYGPTRQFLTDYLPRFGVTTTYIDGSCPSEWDEARKPETTLFYLESPSSVVMKQQDLSAVAGIAKANGITTICDNSWASPIFQSPITHGIDMVVHSATKYLGGHSDIVAGVAVSTKAKMEKLVWNEGCLLGAVLDPFASWLLIRGLRTLPIRMERHHENATELVRRMREHPSVERIFYPGQPDDQQATLTAKQLRGTSGLLSIAFKENSRDAVCRFVDALKHFQIGCSWGGFESLALPSGASLRQVGKSGEGNQWLVRLHIGLENVETLWDDIERSLGD